MNKWLFVALIACVNCSQSLAQAAFPVSNANWCYPGYGDHGEPNGVLCITPIEEVQLNGLVYTRIDFKRHPDAALESLLYREENRKLFVLPQDSVNEILVYDFGLSVGDVFSTNWGWALYDSIHLTVTQIDTLITADGVSRKRMTLTNDSAGLYGTWLEGIGNLEWVFAYPAYQGTVSGGFVFGCHAVDGLLLYPFNISSPASPCGVVGTKNDAQTATTIEIIPNPVGDNLFIQQLHNLNTIRIITIAGEIIYESSCNNGIQELAIPFHWPSGVYLLQAISNDGKTEIAKFIKG